MMMSPTQAAAYSLALEASDEPNAPYLSMAFAHAYEDQATPAEYDIYLKILGY